jgi:hypothetical protein
MGLTVRVFLFLVRQALDVDVVRKKNGNSGLGARGPGLLASGLYSDHNFFFVISWAAAD